MSLSNEWHLVVNGEKSGPHALADLRAKLASLDLGVVEVRVWEPGMAEWVDARTVPGLVDGGVDSVTGGGEVSGAVNPYASPQTVAVLGGDTNIGSPGNHPLDIGLCFQRGWRLTTKNLGWLVLFGLVYFGVLIGIAVCVELINAALGMSEFTGTGVADEGNLEDVSGAATAIYIVVQVIQNLASIFLGIGLAIYGLNMVRNKNPEIGNLFGGGRYFWRILVAAILYGLVVIVGLILFIVPGIYFGVRLGQFQFAIIDRNLGAIDGLKASWEMTRGNVWGYIGLWFVMVAILMLGAMALLVGLIWAYPTIFLATVVAYQVMAYGGDSLPEEDSIA
jgi:uncharacterized membrane protein